MQSPNGDKYCPGCESWQFVHERTPKSLVPLSKETELQVKELNLQKPHNKPFPYDFVLHQSVIRCLQTKLFFLTTLLNNEKDLNKIKELLSLINMCLINLRMAVNLEKL